jgi:hypothetical protein
MIVLTTVGPASSCQLLALEVRRRHGGYLFLTSLGQFGEISVSLYPVMFRLADGVWVMPNTQRRIMGPKGSLRLVTNSCHGSLSDLPYKYSFPEQTATSGTKTSDVEEVQ